MGRYKGASRRIEAVTNREMGDLEGCGERRGLSAHRRPLEAASGRTDTMSQGRGTKLTEVG